MDRKTPFRCFYQRMWESYFVDTFSYVMNAWALLRLVIDTIDSTVSPWKSHWIYFSSEGGIPVCSISSGVPLRAFQLGENNKDNQKEHFSDGMKGKKTHNLKTAQALKKVLSGLTYR